MTQDSSINSNISLDDKPAGKQLITKAMLHNGFSNIKDNLKLMVVLWVLHLSAAPLTLFMLIQQILAAGSTNNVDIYMVIAVASTAAGVGGGILCALSAMPYLYKRSVVDMRLSLPMTTGQRFASDFVSGLFVYMVPFLISQIFTWLMMLAGHILCDGKYFTEYYSDGLSHRWLCTIFEESAPYLLKGVVGGIAIMLMFYVLTVLVASCCGSVFECVCYTLMANGLIPGAIAILIVTFTYNVMGISSDVYMIKYLPYTSPIGGVFGLCMILDNEWGVGEAPWLPTFGKWLICFLIVTVIMTVCSYLIYRKRKAEDTGKPIVFGIFYHVIMTLAIVCITCAFLMDDETREMTVPMIVITAIVYMIFHVVRNRGFAHVIKGIICYVCTMAVCIGSYYLVTGTELFGAAKYVPDADDVSDVYINYKGYFERSDYVSFINTYGEELVKISEPQNIETVVRVHNDTIALADSNSGILSMQGERLSLVYKLKSGKYVCRDYYLYDNVRDDLSSIDMSDEFREFRASNKAAEFLDAKDYIERMKSYGNDAYNTYVTLSPQWRYNKNGGAADNSYSIKLDRLPEDFCDRMAECVYDDIMNETEEQYFSFDGEMWYLSGIASVSLIKENYTNTLAYLRACGFETLPEVSDEAISGYISENMGVFIVSTDVAEKIAGRDITSSTALRESSSGEIHTDSENIFISEYSYVYEYSDDLAEILKHSKKQYKTNENCYTISVNGSAAVIPAEYSQLAEKVYIRAVSAEFIRRLDRLEAEQQTGDVSAGEDDDIIYAQVYSDGEIAAYKVFLKAFLECMGEKKISDASGSREIFALMSEYTAE